VFEADGPSRLLTGTMDFGMGHATPFAQVLSEKLGVPFDKSAWCRATATAAMGGGSAARKPDAQRHRHRGSGGQVIDQGKQIASHELEAAVSDIDTRPAASPSRAPIRSIGIMELAQKIAAASTCRKGIPTSLDVRHVSDGRAARPSERCHVAEVEVDPTTGVIEVVKYSP